MNEVKIGVWTILKDEVGHWRAYHDNYDGAPDSTYEYDLWDYELEGLLIQITEWESESE